MPRASRGKPKGPNRNKPFQEALLIEAKLAENGEPSPAKPGSLRWIARQTLERAGTETAAMKEVAERFDGKVPSGTVLDDTDGSTEIIIRKMVWKDDE